MTDYKWRVVPLSEGQLTDVRSDDVLNNGLYRKCDTYRGGGGYDIFPRLAEKRWGYKLHEQFVVQLFGCHLDCWYCYVTREGVWGPYEEVSTSKLVGDFLQSGQQIFHLMGGSPALYMQHWPELLDVLKEQIAFHSDLLLDEREYDKELLMKISRSNTLYAVDIKGTDKESYEKATRKPYNRDLIDENLSKLLWAGVPFYVTFTGITEEQGENWMMAHGIFNTHDWDIINLINYNAQPYVDRVSWGG